VVGLRINKIEGETMSLREEHRRKKRQAIKKAMDVLRGDAAYDNLEFMIRDFKRFPEEVQDYLWEAIAEVQDEVLPRIGADGVARLEEKLDRMERSN